MAAYTVNDVLVKQILLTYPAGEVIFVRGVMSALLIGAAAAIFGHAQKLRLAMSRMLVARSVCDGLSTAGFIAALAHMKLANIAAVLQVAPLLITALSVFLYRESVGWRRWTAIAVGFSGALLVIKPIPSEFSIWALVAAASAFAAAMREILTRRIGGDTPAVVVAFWGAVFITLFGVPLTIAETWIMPSSADLFVLFIAAIFVGMAIFLLAVGFRDVDLSVVAPFRYTYLLTSAVGGYIAFREFPDGLTIIGAIAIVASGIYILHREASKRRELVR
jgi:drug/metabolite transporter (DMT)-like permease